MGEERETPLMWYLFSKQDSEQALPVSDMWVCAPTFPRGPDGQGTSKDLSVEGLCHQWAWEVLIPSVGLEEDEGGGHTGPGDWHSIWILLEHSSLLVSAGWPGTEGHGHQPQSAQWLSCSSLPGMDPGMLALSSVA